MSKVTAIACGCIALALAGCASVTSDTPLFPASASTPTLDGVYMIASDGGASLVRVRRRDASLYDAELFTPPLTHAQTMAMEFAPVPLGQGDYVLQVSCFALFDAKTKTWKKSHGFGYWTLSAARPAGDFWLGWELTDQIGAALAAKYHQKVDKDGIKLHDMPPDRARAFFRDWQAIEMKDGGDRVLPVVEQHDWAAEDEAAKFAGALACRDVKASK